MSGQNDRGRHEPNDEVVKEARHGVTLDPIRLSTPGTTEISNLDGPQRPLARFLITQCSSDDQRSGISTAPIPCRHRRCPDANTARHNGLRGRGNRVLIQRDTRIENRPRFLARQFGVKGLEINDDHVSGATRHHSEPDQRESMLRRSRQCGVRIRRTPATPLL